jgi:hypothetical protein
MVQCRVRPDRLPRSLRYRLAHLRLVRIRDPCRRMDPHAHARGVPGTMVTHTLATPDRQGVSNPRHMAGCRNPQKSHSTLPSNNPYNYDLNRVPQICTPFSPSRTSPYELYILCIRNKVSRYWRKTLTPSSPTLPTNLTFKNTPYSRKISISNPISYPNFVSLSGHNLSKVQQLSLHLNLVFLENMRSNLNTPRG